MNTIIIEILFLISMFSFGFINIFIILLRKNILDVSHSIDIIIKNYVIWAFTLTSITIILGIIIRKYVRIFFVLYFYSSVIIGSIGIIGIFAFLMHRLISRFKEESDILLFEFKNLEKILNKSLLLLFLALELYVLWVILDSHSIFIEYDATAIYIPNALSIIYNDQLTYNIYHHSQILMTFSPLAPIFYAYVLANYKLTEVLYIFPYQMLLLLAMVTFRIGYIISGKKHATISTLILLSLPIFGTILGAFSLYTDLTFTTTYYLTLYFILQIIKEKDNHKKDFIFFSMSISLFILSKNLAIALVPGIFGIILAMFFNKNRALIRGFFTLLPYLGWGFLSDVPFYIYIWLFFMFVLSLIIEPFESKIHFQKKDLILFLLLLITFNIAPLIFFIFSYHAGRILYYYSPQLASVMPIFNEIFNRKNSIPFYLSANKLHLETFILARYIGAPYVYFLIVGLAFIVYDIGIIKINKLPKREQYIGFYLYVFVLLLIPYIIFLNTTPPVGRFVSECRRLLYIAPVYAWIISYGLLKVINLYNEKKYKMTNHDLDILLFLYIFSIFSEIFINYYLPALKHNNVYSLKFLELASPSEIILFIMLGLISNILLLTRIKLNQLIYNLYKPTIHKFIIKYISYLKKVSKIIAVVTIILIIINFNLVLNIYISQNRLTKTGILREFDTEDVANYFKSIKVQRTVLTFYLVHLSFLANICILEVSWIYDFYIIYQNGLLSNNLTKLKQGILNLNIGYIVAVTPNHPNFYSLERLANISIFFKEILILVNSTYTDSNDTNTKVLGNILFEVEKIFSYHIIIKICLS